MHVLDNSNTNHKSPLKWCINTSMHKTLTYLPWLQNVDICRHMSACCQNHVDMSLKNVDIWSKMSTYNWQMSTCCWQMSTYCWQMSRICKMSTCWTEHRHPADNVDILMKNIDILMKMSTCCAQRRHMSTCCRDHVDMWLAAAALRAAFNLLSRRSQRP